MSLFERLNNKRYNLHEESKDPFKDFNAYDNLNKEEQKKLLMKVIKYLVQEKVILLHLEERQKHYLIQQLVVKFKDQLMLK